MTNEDKPATRGTMAIVVATAAVTLAVGVTAAGLGGFFTPARDVAEPQVSTAPTAPEVRPVAPAEAPTVVLVPVRQDPPLQTLPSGHQREHEGERDDDHDD